MIHIERNDKLTELPPFPPNITTVMLINSPNLKKLSNLPPKLKFLSLDKQTRNYYEAVSYRRGKFRQKTCEIYI